MALIRAEIDREQVADVAWWTTALGRFRSLNWPDFEFAKCPELAEGVEEVLGSARIAVIPCELRTQRGDRGDDG